MQPPLANNNTLKALHHARINSQARCSIDNPFNGLETQAKTDAISVIRFKRCAIKPITGIRNDAL